MSGTNVERIDQSESMFMVRQPIFTRDKAIWGYEVSTSAVPSMLDGAQSSCFADFTAQFQDTLAFLVGGLVKDQKLLVTVGEENLCFDETASTNWGNCIFNLTSNAMLSPQSVDFVDFIHQEGGTIALDGDTSPDVYEPLLANSDFIRVSMAGKAPQEIVGLRRAFKNYPGKFLIQDVGSWQAYEGTRALGFNFFQGSFFTLPEIQKDKEISSGSLAKMQLMKELGNPDCQMDELARIISSDVSLSYRILKYINSASFGFKTVISSIQQAVTLMGLREVRHWAMVVIMTQLDSSPKGEELSYIVLQRARFLSQLAEETEGFPISPSSMFMLGLFSKLDALLSATMEQALEDVPLEDDMRNGLCGEKNIYGDWLQLLTFIEAADWGNAKELLSANDVSHYLAATEYMKASSWAAALKPDS